MRQVAFRAVAEILLLESFNQKEGAPTPRKGGPGRPRGRRPRPGGSLGRCLVSAHGIQGSGCRCGVLLESRCSGCLPGGFSAVMR